MTYMSLVPAFPYMATKYSSPAEPVGDLLAQATTDTATPLTVEALNCYYFIVHGRDDASFADYDWEVTIDGDRATLLDLASLDLRNPAQSLSVTIRKKDGEKHPIASLRKIITPNGAEVTASLYNNNGSTHASTTLTLAAQNTREGKRLFTVPFGSNGELLKAIGHFFTLPSSKEDTDLAKSYRNSCAKLDITQLPATVVVDQPDPCLGFDLETLPNQLVFLKIEILKNRLQYYFQYSINGQSVPILPAEYQKSFPLASSTETKTVSISIMQKQSMGSQPTSGTDQPALTVNIDYTRGSNSPLITVHFSDPDIYVVNSDCKQPDHMRREYYYYFQIGALREILFNIDLPSPESK